MEAAAALAVAHAYNAEESADGGNGQSCLVAWPSGGARIVVSSRAWRLSATPTAGHPSRPWLSLPRSRVEAAGSDDFTAWRRNTRFSFTRQEQDDPGACIFLLRER